MKFFYECVESKFFCFLRYHFLYFKFTKVIATDNVMLTKESVMKNNLIILYNLIRMVNGPIQQQDKVIYNLQTK